MSGRVFVVGDVHGSVDISKMYHFSQSDETLTKEDIVIIAGDAGILWDADPETFKQTAEVWNRFPWTTLWVDGNHENFDLLKSLEQRPECNIDLTESALGKLVSPLARTPKFVTAVDPELSVYHLKRGGIYEINGKVIFVFGGAASIDKRWRVQGLSWWPEELPSIPEMGDGIINLRNFILGNGGVIDCIITHTCSTSVKKFWLENHIDEGNVAFKLSDHPDAQAEKGLNDYLDFVWKTIVTNQTKPLKNWIFGHFHIDETQQISTKFETDFDIPKDINQIESHTTTFTCHYNNSPIQL